jgi:tetratricopeptide (TPR) repeat protein
VLRKKGDIDGALAALENVTMLEPDHVGALALLGEVYITKGNFADAAPALARIALHEQAPRQQRLMSGVAAVDLFEKKLGQPQKALEVLVGMHKAGLSTLAVRERLATVAARAGAWAEATSILEQLMTEREKKEGRVEAARLAMNIHRDKLGAAPKAEGAVKKLLDEWPDDGEAIDFVLATDFPAAFKQQMLARAKQTLIAAVAVDPAHAGRVELLSKLAAHFGDGGLRQATLGSLVSLGKNTKAISDELGKLDGRVATQPEVVLDAQKLAEIADPEDNGPIADLMPLIAEMIPAALGPSLASLNVGKKDRVDARGGHPLRLAVAAWMGALGMSGEFELYIGGSDPRGVVGVPGETPAVVLGSGITQPFDAAARAAVARAVLGLKRGINAVQKRDERAIASLIAASCIEAGVAYPAPQFAVYGEIARAVKSEMPRRVRKAIPEVCQRVLQSRQDPVAWALAAQRSLDRMAVIAAGDVSIVLADALKASRDSLGGQVAESERAKRLLGFVLSPSYLELRKKLGMGVR